MRTVKSLFAARIRGPLTEKEEPDDDNGGGDDDPTDPQDGDGNG